MLSHSVQHQEKRTWKEKASYRKIKTMGGFYMARSYTHMELLKAEIFKMRTEGKTRKEIAEHFGLSVVQIKNLINRHNRAKKREGAGIVPLRSGRPPKGYAQTEQEKDNIIRRLKMENELLRDFLRYAERG
jgi:transposase